MMEIGVYFPSNNKEHSEVLTAFLGGLEKHGVTVRACLLEHFNAKYYDAAVVYGVGKRAVPYSRFRQAVRTGYHWRNKRVVVLEKGYIRRDQYYAAGWDGLNGRADFMNEGMFSDRWNALGVELQPYKENKDGHIMLMGQVPWDASVQDLNHKQWLVRTVQDLQRYTARRIFYRPHPLAGNSIRQVAGAIAVTGDLDAALDNAWAVVTHNSNTAVDALLAGVPVWASDHGSMAWGVAHHTFDFIEDPAYFERQHWANDLAYAQWSLEEMANGDAWAHLGPGLSMPICERGRAAGAPGLEPFVGSAPN